MLFSCINMSGYKIYYNGVLTDLSDLFLPKTNGPDQVTGYKSGQKDLGSMFQAGDSGIITGYLLSDKKDLGNIFQKKQQFSVTGGYYQITSTVSSNITTYNIVIQPGTTTLTFFESPKDGYCNFQLVGGGGGGGGCWCDVSGDVFQWKLYSGAGGGGGGNLLVNNYNIKINNPYTIIVGDPGSLGYSNDGFSGEATSGGPGGNTTITDSLSPNLNLIAYGGAGGGAGSSSSKSIGGKGGSFYSNVGGNGGDGGDGGKGNGGSSGNWNTGTSGTNGYFFNKNTTLNYSPSTAYPTYYRPPVPNYPYATNPDSITLTNWYTVSGGGGAGNSDTSNQIDSGNGGSGEGSGGLNGGNYSVTFPITNPPPYASFGGGGGGGGFITPGYPGGSGLVIIWFSY